MDILIDQTKNIPFKEAFVIMKENVIKGVSLPEMLRRSEKNLETTYKKIPAGLFLLSLSQALEMGSLTGDMGKILYDSFLTYDEILSQKIDVGIKLFDRILYMGIVLIMGVLFYAMGTAMATLYQNAGSMVG
jgi:type II secretory pathway component PulF